MWVSAGLTVVVVTRDDGDDRRDAEDCESGSSSPPA